MTTLTAAIDTDCKEDSLNELWAVAYGSKIYNVINWNSGFMASRYMDQNSLRSGTPYLLGTGHHLPNRWTFVFSQRENTMKTLQQIKDCWQKLGQPRLRFFSDNPATQSQLEELLHGEIAPKRLFLERDS